jgi:hypothetical protein
MRREQTYVFGVRHVVSVCAIILLVTSYAGAQPAVEISGGLMRLQPDEEYWDGWFGDAAFHITGWWELVGEVGNVHRASTWSLRPADIPSLFPHTLSIDRSIHHFLGGPRVSLSGRSAVEPFAQALLGVARWSSRGAAIGGEPAFARDSESNVTDSSTGVTIQPGAGITLRLGRIGVRAAVDYRRTFLGERACRIGCNRAFQLESRGDDTFRVSVGASWAFGLP